MNKKYYKNEKFEAVIPENWNVEEDDGVISLYDLENGVGVLQFSIFSLPHPSDIALKEQLMELLDNKVGGDIIANKDLAQAYYLDEDENRYWKYWLIKKNDVLIFGSYNSEKDDKEVEERLVEEVIHSILHD